MKSDEYMTIQGGGEGIYKEKGSRFLAFSFNVATVEEAKEIIAEKKKEFHDARHHCFAWKIGPGEDNFRQGDDGEPSGTAGKPIYGQIISAGLTNTLIVVVRYFGGIKLGTGGLIVAYKTAAADCLANSTIVTKTWDSSVSFKFPYIAMNDVMRALKDSSAQIDCQNFDNDCTMTLSIRNAELASMRKKLGDIEGLVFDD